MITMTASAYDEETSYKLHSIFWGEESLSGSVPYNIEHEEYSEDPLKPDYNKDNCITIDDSSNDSIVFLECISNKKRISNHTYENNKGLSSKKKSTFSRSHNKSQALVTLNSRNSPIKRNTQKYNFSKYVRVVCNSNDSIQSSQNKFMRKPKKRNSKTMKKTNVREQCISQVDRCDFSKNLSSYKLKTPIGSTNCTTVQDNSWNRKNPVKYSDYYSVCSNLVQQEPIDRNFPDNLNLEITENGQHHSANEARCEYVHVELNDFNTLKSSDLAESFSHNSSKCNTNSKHLSQPNDSRIQSVNHKINEQGTQTSFSSDEEDQLIKAEEISQVSDLSRPNSPKCLNSINCENFEISEQYLTIQYHSSNSGLNLASYEKEVNSVKIETHLQSDKEDMLVKENKVSQISNISKHRKLKSNNCKVTKIEKRQSVCSSDSNDDYKSTDMPIKDCQKRLQNSTDPDFVINLESLKNENNTSSDVLNPEIDDILLIAWKLEVDKLIKKSKCDCESAYRSLTEDGIVDKTIRINFITRKSCCELRKIVLSLKYAVSVAEIEMLIKNKRNRLKKLNKINS